MALARFMWREVSPDAQRHMFWGPGVFSALLERPNGFSMRDYWSRMTFGLLNLEFVIPRIWAVSDESQDALRGDRDRMLQVFRQLYVDNGGSLDGIDRVAVFVHPPPCNAGATGDGNVVLDQGGSVEFFQHEFGHLLGFMHSFGPAGVYGDDYCVMGSTGPRAHPVDPPPEAAGFTFLDPPRFWSSGRRLSAAALYRRFVERDVGGSGDPRSGRGAAGPFDSRVLHVGLGGTARIAPLSWDGGKPVVAVTPLPVGALTVEYRPQVGDDVNVVAAVVVHTLGTRPNEAGAGEVAPPRFEAAIPPTVGAAITLAVDGQGYRVEVQDVRPGVSGPSVRVGISGGFPVPVYPRYQPGWRWCSRCQGLAYCYGAFNGPCPHPEGGTHGLIDSALYGLLHDVPSPVQDGWQWCNKCACLSRMRPPVGSIPAAHIPRPCAAGGVHSYAGSGAYTLVFDVEPSVGQDLWRQCARCDVLAYGGNPPGPCPAGDRHALGGSRNYSLPHDAGLAGAQPDWRWCNRCGALAFAGNGPKPCPAGGTHDHTGSFRYEVPVGVPNAGGQDNWRWCNRCQGLTYAGFGTGVCPAGGGHDHGGSWNYLLLGNIGLNQRDWRWCARCQGLAYGGFGSGFCPAGGQHDLANGSSDYTMLLAPPQAFPS
ncbi:hypothetical protein ABZS66_20420 [Dactylosporangium sp. NPDC005572]|uniref:hypothetical protein n=1 Tax=Dactylosporangium sp. NPDC005572 TaxID=3156889 RepID=UPI0033B11306